MRIFSVLSALLALLVCGPASALDPAPVNDESGCSRGKAPEMSKKECADFDVAGVNSRDDSIKAAYGKCLAFYESALRVQNTFCAYRMDAVIFQGVLEAPANATNATSVINAANVVDTGLANVSEVKVGLDNQDVANLTKGYIAKLTALAPRFRDAYVSYESAIGKMNGGGGTDEFYEATCAASMVTGQVPGYLRELLATQSHENARMTYNSMWTAIRTNVKSLQSVKAEAEQNAKLAQFRAVDVGSVFQKEVQQAGSADSRQPMTRIEGATVGAWQYLYAEASKKILPKLTDTSAAVIGGGIVLIYQYATNKVIMYPETAATFVGMLNPVAGIAANMVVAVARTMEGNVKAYRAFAKQELSQNINLTSMQLIDAWGKSQNLPACSKSAAEESACIEARKTTQQAYEHNSCSRSPVFGNGSGTPASASSITGP